MAFRADDYRKFDSNDIPSVRDLEWIYNCLSSMNLRFSWAPQKKNVKNLHSLCRTALLELEKPAQVEWITPEFMRWKKLFWIELCNVAVVVALSDQERNGSMSRALNSHMIHTMPAVSGCRAVIVRRENAIRSQPFKQQADVSEKFVRGKNMKNISNRLGNDKFGYLLFFHCSQFSGKMCETLPISRLCVYSIIVGISN